MNYNYLQSWEFWRWLRALLPFEFIRSVHWRQISEEKFLRAVRPFHENTSDEDILIFFEGSPSLTVFDGKHAYRARAHFIRGRNGREYE
jgi:hypothetical protein